jgi:fumarylacetoacetate (FAA) hydrolase
MKLASLKDGSRDGRLVVVSKDLTQYTDVSHIAPTMRAALDDWANCEHGLQDAAHGLMVGAVPAMRFHEHDAEAPLPRAAQWADGSAYVNHVELVRKARGAEMPETFWSVPLMYMGAPDAMLGARDDIPVGDEEWGIDMEAEIGVIVDDVPMGISAEEAADKILLVVILNDISFRNLIPDELAKGFGFFQSKGPTAFSPVAVTPNELGDAWRDGKLHLPILVQLNGELFGKANGGVDMTFDFPTLVAHAAKTRAISAGSIIGSGTVSNKLDGGPGKPIGEGGDGYSCIAEIRTIEVINSGKPATPYLGFDDTVRIEMNDEDGHSIFGAIEQMVEKVG